MTTSQAAPAEVWVRTGRYTPVTIPSGAPVTATNRSVPFLMRENVHVYGGFAGTETLRSQRASLFSQTTLSGDLLNDSIPGTMSGRSDDSYNVVFSFDDTDDWRLDGFTVEYGHADGGPLVGFPIGFRFTDQGGGIYFEGPFPTPTPGGPSLFGQLGVQVRNVTVQECRAKKQGGGVWINGAANLVDAPQPGGNIQAVWSKCIIRNNWVYGSDPNVDEGEGGGLFIRESSNNATNRLTFVNCLFQFNRAARFGGAITTREQNGPVDFVNCLVHDNVAQAGGGMAFMRDPSTASARVDVINCTIAFNQAIASASSLISGGGGFYADLSSITSFPEVFLRNTDVAENTARRLGNPPAPLPGSFGGPGAPFTAGTQPLVQADHCCIEHVLTPGVPNPPYIWWGQLVVANNPNFVNGPTRDLRLGTNSVCLNTGDDNFLPNEYTNLLSMDGAGPLLPSIAFDFSLLPREMNAFSGTLMGGIDGGNVLGAIVDMGCFEANEDE